MENFTYVPNFPPLCFMLCYVHYTRRYVTDRQVRLLRYVTIRCSFLRYVRVENRHYTHNAYALNSCITSHEIVWMRSRKIKAVNICYKFNKTFLEAAHDGLENINSSFHLHTYRVPCQNLWVSHSSSRRHSLPDHK